jgi:glucosamine kinase
MFLGIDIGGTKTECAVGDANRVFATAQESSAKPGRVSDAEARRVLQSAVEKACRAAGAEPHSIQRACVGTSGASRVEVRDLIRGALQELVAGEVVIVGDMEVAHQAAFAGSPGIVVISGTGSVAYGVNAKGSSARAGGWGAPISDEGSGDWIGRTAVGDVLVAHDTGAHSGLLHRLCDAWGVSSPAELARLANASPPPDFAALCPEVIASDGAGDTLARDLLVRAAHELSQLTMIVVRRLWPEESHPSQKAGERVGDPSGARMVGRPEIAMSGGVFVHSATMREVFSHILANLRPDATVLLSSRSAAEGALMIARSAAKSAHP